MKVLITGANGQLGQTLLDYGKHCSSITLIALSRKDCDIYDTEKLQAVINSKTPDIIINAAAYTNVEKAEDEIELANKINSIAVEQLAIICQKQNIPLIHISTDFVFGDEYQDRLIKENDEPKPINEYGKSKLAGEQKIIKHLDRYIILRTSWLFSDKVSKNFYNTMVRLARERDEINVVADQQGCPTATDSLAKVIYMLLEKYQQNQLPWGIYHYSDQPITTWYGFAKEIMQQFSLHTDKKIKVNPIKASEYPSKVQRPKNAIMDCSKICKLLQIQQFDWRKVVIAYMDKLSVNSPIF